MGECEGMYAFWLEGGGEKVPGGRVGELFRELAAELEFLGGVDVPDPPPVPCNEVNWNGCERVLLRDLLGVELPLLDRCDMLTLMVSSPPTSSLGYNRRNQGGR